MPSHHSQEATLNEEERRELILDAKAYYLAAPILVPMIERRKKVAQQKLLSAFREGRTDLLALVAEFAAFSAVEDEIRTREATYTQLDQQEKK